MNSRNRRLGAAFFVALGLFLALHFALFDDSASASFLPVAAPSNSTFLSPEAITPTNLSYVPNASKGFPMLRMGLAAYSGSAVTTKATSTNCWISMNSNTEHARYQV